MDKPLEPPEEAALRRQVAEGAGLGPEAAKRFLATLDGSRAVMEELARHYREEIARYQEALSHERTKNAALEAKWDYFTKSLNDQLTTWERERDKTHDPL